MPKALIIGGAVIAGLGLLGGIASTVVQSIGQRNEREQIERHREEDRELFLQDREHAENREDTVLTRRMAEAKDLGLHPSTVMGGSSHAIMSSGSSGISGNSILDIASGMRDVSQMALTLGMMGMIAGQRGTVRQGSSMRSVRQHSRRLASYR